MPRVSKLFMGIVLMLAGYSAHAQRINSFRQMMHSLRNDPVLRSIGIPDTGTIKCATPFVLAIRLRWNQLAPQSRTRLSSILQRTPLQTSRLSPSGKFRIHYDTTGSNQPALIAAGQDVPNSYNAYVDSVGAILDYVWDYEIDTLGYAPPLPDGTQGGGPEYDVYIVDLGPGVFGYTDWDPNDPGALVNGGNVRYPTFMTIDKDFLTLRTPGMNGLKVTCAHEFHHAIQMGGYGMWTESDFYFNELTSSWMEDVVYTQVNDYYFDVVNYFQGFRDSQGFPLSFTYYNRASFAGYERCIFGHFLAKRYGRDIMREIWTGMRTEPFIESARDVFARHGTDWATEFSTFTYWNYFTADRADTVRFYPEGKYYPRFEPNFSTDFSSSTNTSSISSGAYPLSSSMFEFHLLAQQDTVSAIVANTDVNAVLGGDGGVRQLEIDLTKGVLSIPHVSLADGYNAGISTIEPNQWRTFYTLASTKTDIPKLKLQASPNPFRITEASQLLLPLDGAPGSRASVYFLSSSLTLQYSAEFDVENQFGNQFIAVPSSEIRSRLSSGIYFVVAKIAGNEYTWKVAIIQ
jgi:hypothetical protein